jgi:acetyl-CoA carboxylase biotin carboxyl carrier protein
MSEGRKKRVAAEPNLPIDHDLIRELARLLDETGLTEIEFERDGHRVRVARHAQATRMSGRVTPPSIPAWSPHPW